MLTLHEPNRSTCMSEIVKPYLGQPSTLESRFEAAVHEVAGVRWRARRRGENVLRVLYLYLLSCVTPECLYSLLREFYADPYRSWFPLQFSRHGPLTLCVVPATCFPVDRATLAPEAHPGVGHSGSPVRIELRTDPRVRLLETP